MDFTLNIDNSLIFNFSQSDNMEFKIGTMPEKEYIEKDLVPCAIAFSADPIYADVVSVVFRKEEEDDLINGN